MGMVGRRPRVQEAIPVRGVVEKPESHGGVFLSFAERIYNECRRAFAATSPLFHRPQRRAVSCDSRNHVFDGRATGSLCRRNLPPALAPSAVFQEPLASLLVVSRPCPFFRSSFHRVRATSNFSPSAACCTRSASASRFTGRRTIRSDQVLLAAGRPEVRRPYPLPPAFASGKWDWPPLLRGPRQRPPGAAAWFGGGPVQDAPRRRTRVTPGAPRLALRRRLRFSYAMRV